MAVYIQERPLLTQNSSVPTSFVHDCRLTSHNFAAFQINCTMLGLLLVAVQASYLIDLVRIDVPPSQKTIELSIDNTLSGGCAVRG